MMKISPFVVNGEKLFLVSKSRRLKKKGGPCLFIVWISCFYAIGSISGVWAQTPQTPSSVANADVVSKEFDADGEQLRKLARLKDLNAVERFGSVAVKKWSAVNRDFGLEMLCNFCNILASSNFGDDRQYELASKYARAELVHADEIPIDCETRLVCCLTNNSPYFKRQLKDEDWKAYREQKARLWLHPLTRIDKEIDRSFNPFDLSKWPQLNLAPVINGQPGYFSVDPDRIQDPVVRANYRKALDENVQKGEKINLQMRIHDADKVYGPFAEKYLIGIYSLKPYDNDGLKRILQGVGLSQERQMRIILGVEKNTGSTLK